MNSSKNDSSNSDSSDEDYCPETVKEELSEESSDDACEDDSGDEQKGQKRSKKCKTKYTKRRKTEESPEAKNVDKSATETGLNEEDKKKKADSLWADFLSGTGTKPKPKSDSNGSLKQENKVPNKVEKPKPAKEVVTVKQIFDFAGEKVEVTKEVPADSVEARLAGTNDSTTKETPDKKPAAKPAPKKSGMQSILSQINKKNKISTLEKSKLDWDGFKKKQGIEEEIQNHNKGKNGYLERQDFLQRADLRQFEIEKEMRTTRRSNR